MITKTRTIRSYEPRKGQFFFLEGSDVPVKIIKELGDGSFVILEGGKKRAVSYLHLRSELNLPILPPGQGAGFIRQYVNITTVTSTVAEGTTKAVVVAIPKVQTLPVKVYFEVQNLTTTSADYTVTASPITIQPGSTTAEITLNITALDGAEGEEAMLVKLTRADTAKRGPTSGVVLRIAASAT